jgi:hypothetical protein
MSETTAEFGESFAEPQTGVWSNEHSDLPVTVLGSYGPGPDGREYLRIEGSTVGIPADEFKRHVDKSMGDRVGDVLKRINRFIDKL